MVLAAVVAPARFRVEPAALVQPPVPPNAPEQVTVPLFETEPGLVTVKPPTPTVIVPAPLNAWPAAVTFKVVNDIPAVAVNTAPPVFKVAVPVIATVPAVFTTPAVSAMVALEPLKVPVPFKVTKPVKVLPVAPFIINEPLVIDVVLSTVNA